MDADGSKQRRLSDDLAFYRPCDQAILTARLLSLNLGQLFSVCYNNAWILI